MQDQKSKFMQLGSFDIKIGFHQTCYYKPPWKIWKADNLSISLSSDQLDKGLILETSAFQIFHQGN